jgi:tetratricopeptide (TPR) repeat protein
MHKKIFLFLLFNFVTVYSYAQNKKVLDSLAIAYQNAQHDTTRIILLCNIAFEYRRNNPDTCIAISQKALALSEKIKFHKGQGEGYYHIGLGYDYQDNYSTALDYFQKSLKIKENLGDKRGCAKSLNNIGIIYDIQGNYPLSLDYYQKSLKIREELQDKVGIAASLNNIGGIYDMQANYPLALAYHQKSLKIKEELKDKKGIAISFNNIGNIYEIQGNYALALDYYQKSLKIKEEFQDEEGISASLNNIGGIYDLQGNYVLALAYHQKSLKIKEILNDKLGITHSFNSLAQVYQKQKDYEKSIEYAHKGLKIAQEIEALSEIQSVSQTLYASYKLQGNYSKALQYHELYKISNDSLFNVENSKAIANLEGKANVERKEKEIAILNKNQEILQTAKEFQQKINYLVLCVLISVLVLAYFIYRSQQKEKSAKEETLQINEELHTLLLTVSDQKTIIEQKNDNIIASINYALRIQNAIIPRETDLQQHLDCFVFFRPRDIVSGDFYWFAEKENTKILVVADCTGHGVSGAFMAMLGNDLLNQIVHNQEIHRPDLILNQMQELLHKVFAVNHQEIADGMDIAIIAIQTLQGLQDLVRFKVEYSGAKTPLYWVTIDNFTQETQLHEIKADRIAIEGRKHLEYYYKLHTLSNQALRTGVKDIENFIAIPKDTSISFYLCSDGYQDQFGSQPKRKLLSANLKKILLKAAPLATEQQKILVSESFDNWRGEHKQVDDVLVVGVKL